MNEELKAAYERIDELIAALNLAQTQIVNLGGDDPVFGCPIQTAVLTYIEEALP